MSQPEAIPTPGELRDTIQALTEREAKLTLHYLSGLNARDVLLALDYTSQRVEERRIYIESLKD